MHLLSYTSFRYTLYTFQTMHKAENWKKREKMEPKLPTQQFQIILVEIISVKHNHCHSNHSFMMLQRDKSKLQWIFHWAKMTETHPMSFVSGFVNLHIINNDLNYRNSGCIRFNYCQWAAFDGFDVNLKIPMQIQLKFRVSSWSSNQPRDMPSNDTCENLIKRILVICEFHKNIR